MRTKENPKDPQQFYEFLHRAVPQCIDFARDLKFDKTHKWQMSLVALYGTILELSHSIVALIAGDAGIGIPILLRSLLEAFVDFKNLSESKSYGYNLEAAHAKEWIKILQEAKLGHNAYLTEISLSPDLDKIITDLKMELNELAKRNAKPLSIYAKFAIANQSEEYKSFYNFLCCDTHNNLRALIHRHAKITEKLADYEVQFFKDFNLDDNLHYIDSCLGILFSSTEIIHKILESPKRADIEKLQNELSSLREPWLG